MNNLSNRMKTFSGSRLQQGIESLTPQVTHEHDAVLGEDIVHPNPIIVNEFYDIIDEDEAIDTDDTAFNLLSDSTEALRRLEILQMNVNYPVSGYRLSRATLCMVDSGLESMANTPTFSKKALSSAIEGIAAKIVLGVLVLLITMIGTVIYKSIKMYKQFMSSLGDGGLSSQSGMLQMIIDGGAQLKIKDVKKSLEMNAPKFFQSAKDSQTVDISDFLNAIFSETVWSKITPFQKNLCFADGGNLTESLVTQYLAIYPGIPQYVDDLTNLLEKTSEVVKGGSGNLNAVFEDINSKYTDFNKQITELTQAKRNAAELSSSVAKDVTAIQFIEAGMSLETQVKRIGAADPTKLQGKVDVLSSKLKDLEKSVRTSGKQQDDVVKASMLLIKEQTIHFANVMDVVGDVCTTVATVSNTFEILIKATRGTK